MKKPLSGVKVLEVDTFTAASACGRLLGEWGAEVIKVEMVTGEPGRVVAGATFGAPCLPEENPCFECNNAYKKSLALNLKDPRGLDALHKLADQCNVFFTNYRPNALKKMGLDYESFHKLHPHTIWAQLTGYGEVGPAADDAGYDAVAFWARSGAMIDSAEKDTVPIIPVTGFGDRTTSCSLAGAICAALYHQAKTGEGQKITVSLYGQAIWNAGETIWAVQYGDKYPKSRENPGTPIANSYKDSNGEWMYISCYNYPGQFPGLVKALGREDLLSNEKFANLRKAKENGKELVSILESEFAKHDAQYWTSKMKEFDVPFAVVKHVTDVFTDEQAKLNGFVLEYSHRNGKTTIGSQSPVQFGESEDLSYVNAPLLGADSKHYLKEAGLSDEEIQQMINDKVTVTIE